MNAPIYNPLARGSVLYHTWTTMGDSSSRTKPPDALLVQRYVNSLVGIFKDRKRHTSVGGFVGPSRPIVGDFQNLLDVITLGPPFEDALPKSDINLYFPVLDRFDAWTEDGAVFISSRYLDAIEFFAHCIAGWSALNFHLSEKALPSTAWPVPYAWLPFLVNQGYVDLDELPRGYVEYHNSLMQDFLRGMIMFIDPPRVKTKNILRDGPKVIADDRDGFIEPRYLAAATLLYVYLHECVHIVLGHNEQMPQLTPFERAVEDSINTYIDEHNESAGDVVFERLWERDADLVFSRETAADIHAVHSTMPEYGDAVLEAASLWLTAQGTCHSGGADVFDAFYQSTGELHPPFPTRVWALNGALSTLARQGHVAQAVRGAAEVMAGAAVPFRPEPKRRHVPLLKGLLRS